MNLLSHGTRVSLPIRYNDPRLQTLRDGLERFELGRFLLANGGLNGAWTAYVTRYPEHGRLTGRSSDGLPMSALERWLLEACPIFLATQERFRTFREITQTLVMPAGQLASVPCGRMDDLVTLDYRDAPGAVLHGIDLDMESLWLARENIYSLGETVGGVFMQADAWSLPFDRHFDVLTSNGLNLYVEDDRACTSLYRRFARALKPGGHLVTSFITPVHEWKPWSETALALQQRLFNRVLRARWQCLRSEALTTVQLEQAGLEVVEIRYDKQRMFPTVVAKRVS